MATRAFGQAPEAGPCFRRMCPAERTASFEVLAVSTRVTETATGAVHPAKRGTHQPPYAC